MAQACAIAKYGEVDEKLKMKLKEWLLEQKTMGTSLLKTVLWGHQELY